MTEFDSKIDHRPPDSGSATSPSPGSFAPDKRVVEGNGPPLAVETRWLLQQRLRAALLVLVVGFGLFFVRSLLLHTFEWIIALFHGMMLGLLILSLGALSSRWKPTLRQLRTFEMALFATITVFIMATQYVRMLRGESEDNPMQVLAAVKISVLWMLSMILTYAIFIPNDWRRAAKVIVPMALAPVAVPWILGSAHPELYKVAVRAVSLEQASVHTLFLFLSAFTAIYGTHTINTLRTEAYQARLVNQYHLRQRLGGGGMGDVFLAEHQLLKRPCAIKLIRPEHLGNSYAMARFEREVRATARLSHWNTIEIYDYGRNDDGAFYYVMEYLPGLGLDVLVQRFGPLPPARVIYLLRQACDALHEAHESGLIHRDIKPSNLFAAYRGGHHDVTKLLDFGLVKTLRGEDSIQLTQEGAVYGSPLYVAPEQVLHSHPLDRRTDIYSLGAVAYFLLTGRPPFMGDKPMAVMIAHTRDPVVPPTEIKPEIPADLGRVVLRCLAKSPDERYPDAQSLAQALDACADASSWSPQHAAEWWRTHGGVPPPPPPKDDSLRERRREPASALQSAEGPRWL